jgi:hypothetical protein
MAEPKWLSAEEMRAWQAFLAAAALLDWRLDLQLKEEAACPTRSTRSWSGWPPPRAVNCG